MCVSVVFLLLVALDEELVPSQESAAFDYLRFDAHVAEAFPKQVLGSLPGSVPRVARDRDHERF